MGRTAMCRGIRGVGTTISILSAGCQSRLIASDTTAMVAERESLARSFERLIEMTDYGQIVNHLSGGDAGRGAVQAGSADGGRRGVTAGRQLLRPRADLGRPHRDQGSAGRAARSRH